MEIEQYHKNGRIINIEVNARPLLDDDNKVYSILGISRDITERKKMEKELKNAKNRAEKSDNLKSAFLANMSHEIRTPMTAIIGSADLMIQDEIIEEHKEYLKIIKDSGDLLLSIINNILDLSKIEADQLIIEPVSVSLEEILDKVSSNGRIIISQKGKDIKLSYNINNNINENIFADSIRLQQVLNNLVSNAIKFTEKGFVKIDVNLVSSKYLEFRVYDTGIGVPYQIQELI